MCEMGGWLTWLCLCVGMGALDGVSVCGGALLPSPTPAALYASVVYYMYALELEGTRGGGREGG